MSQTFEEKLDALAEMTRDVSRQVLFVLSEDPMVPGLEVCLEVKFRSREDGVTVNGSISCDRSLGLAVVTNAPLGALEGLIRKIKDAAIRKAMAPHN